MNCYNNINKLIIEIKEKINNNQEIKDTLNNLEKEKFFIKIIL